MITAVFEQAPGGLRAVQVSGHAGYAQAGRDIVCAAVTSALQMAANGITEILGEQAGVAAEENLVRVELPPGCSDGAKAFLAALRLHLELLQQDYPDTIHLTISEV